MFGAVCVVFGVGVGACCLVGGVWCFALGSCGVLCDVSIRCWWLVRYVYCLCMRWCMFCRVLCLLMCNVLWSVVGE